MEIKELALVVFTVLTQAAIGAFVLIGWLRLRNRDEAMDPAYRKAVLALVPIMAIAMLASLFHLGRPMLAITAMRNLATSWLSREIFFSGGFFVLLCASAALEKSPAVRRIFDGLAALAGVLSIISMASLYDVTMIPAWQGWGTYVAFVGTALMVGLGLAAGLVAYFGRGSAGVAGDLQVLVGAAVVSLVIGLVAYPLYLVLLGGGGAEAQATLSMLGGEYGMALVLRWALTLAGGLVPLILSWRRLASGKATGGLVYTALVCLLAGELVGRYLFYATGVIIHIG